MITRILIAEDAHTTQLIYRHALSKITKTEIRIDIADNGKDAINLLKSKTYDIAILDHHIPYYTGYEVINYYKKHINGPMKIISISSESNNAFNESYKRHSILSLSKPIEPKRLISTIETMIDEIKEHPKNMVIA